MNKEIRKFLKFLYTPPCTEYESISNYNERYYDKLKSKKIIVRFDVGERKELRIYDSDWLLIYKYDRYSKWENGFLHNSNNLYKRAQFKTIYVIGEKSQKPFFIYFPNDNKHIIVDYDDSFFIRI